MKVVLGNYKMLHICPKSDHPNDAKLNLQFNAKIIDLFFIDRIYCLLFGFLIRMYLQSYEVRNMKMRSKYHPCTIHNNEYIYARL